ncbi:MAG TPA: P1 family peptidase [Tissierellaceae bacterium]|nr:P1 family peptidase [Tissierellaceae bacterium]
MHKGYITDIEGLKVGHSQCEQGLTGCTVIIAEEGATGGVDVRGAAPGTRETDLLSSEKMIEQIHAVVLAGGSAFGLEASSGVMNYLEESNVGFDVDVTRVPIVTSAVIFDLNIGDPKIRPDYKMGYEAAKTASSKERRQGNIGCGMGATVGKILGPDGAMKSGLGSATVTAGELKVSALVVVNSFGDIFDYRNNKQIAGVYDYGSKKLLNTYQIMKEENKALKFSMTNTTIGLVATNAVLSKAEANKIAQMGHNGFARSIDPIHTMLDGDTIFTMATNKIKADINLVGSLAAEAVSQAISNGIYNAEGIEGLYAFRDIKGLD